MKSLPVNDIKALYDRLTTARHIVIVSHIRPDGDAVGSCVALLSWLKNIGSEATVILPQRHPQSTGFLMEEAIVRDIIEYDRDKEAARKAIGKSDLIVFLDINTASRTGDGVRVLIEQSKADRILIDHHLGAVREDFTVCFSETEISSTCELLYYILLRMPTVKGIEDLPELTRSALMTGMTTDTNNFANSVFPSTLEMASGLLAAGVDRDKIINQVFNGYGLNRIGVTGFLLSKVKITSDGVAYMVLSRSASRRFALEEGDTEGIVNMPLVAREVRMSILLKEEKDLFRVSIRSKKGTSANRCAVRYFNGGGHELASGGNLPKTTVRDCRCAAAYIEEATRKFFAAEQE